MPTYQYHCKKCGESFERTEPILLLQCCGAAALALAAFPFRRRLGRTPTPGQRMFPSRSQSIGPIAMGGTIKRCWFNAADPLLPKHVIR